MRLIRSLFALALLAGAGYLTYGLWYPPLVKAVPAAALFLPMPASYNPPMATVIPLPPAGSAALDPTPPALMTIDPAAATPATTAPASSAPIVLATPAAPVLSGVASPWQYPDCAWARAYMAEDLNLDRAEENGLRDGSRHDYPASYWTIYAVWVSRWEIISGQIEGVCENRASATLPDPSAVAQSIEWFNAAIANHEYDLQHAPGNAGWDQQWIAYYRHYIALFDLLGTAG